MTYIFIIAILVLIIVYLILRLFLIRINLKNASEELARTREEGYNRQLKITLNDHALEMLAGEFMEYYPACSVRVIPVNNRFFGESITVAGLVTGQDLIGQLEGNDLGDELLIPQNMLRSGENVFLDDITTEEVSERLHIPVRVTGSAGRDLLSAFLGTEADCQSFHNEYEPGF